MKKTMGFLAALVAVLWTGIGWAEIPKNDSLNANQWRPEMLKKNYILTLLAGLLFLMSGGMANAATIVSPPSAVYYGGAGNESGYSITTGDGGVFVSGWSGFTDANSGDGLVLRYTNSLSLEWNATWPDLSGWDVFRGVGVSTEGVYVAGVSYNRTSDTMGDKEQKGIVVKFPLTGATGGGYDGAIWDKQTPSAPGAFSYGGGEGLNALVQTEESGQTYIYATGAAQSGWSNCGRLYLSKLGADGTIIWTVNDGSEQVGYSISFGSAITTLNGNIYVAGQNDGSGSATCGTTSSKPYMRKYDRDGNLLWSRMSSLSGAYYGIASFGGTIYAVGTTPWESPTSYNFLIEKWDESGNLTWSKQYDRNSSEDILYGVTGAGSTIYAAGSTNGNTAGGRDAIILEIDPATGDILSSTLYGGAQDDIARSIAVNGTDLYVAGETQSYGSGGKDVMVLRFIMTTPSLIGGAIQGTPLDPAANNVTTFAGSAGISGSTNATGTSARFSNPRNITTDGTNLFVADMGNDTIRKIVISTAEVTTLAGSAGSSGSADGTGTSASFNGPVGITTDGTNLFVTDNYSHTIRKIVISTAEVTTLAGSAGSSGSADGTGTAAQFYYPWGITTDGTNLFVTDSYNNTIRKIVISTGVVTTIAGTAGSSGSTDGTSTAARFYFPLGITTDGTNLFVVDERNHTLRKIVISTAEVTTLAGTAGSSGSTDGTGTSARFNLPRAITTDGTNLFVSDGDNQTIRKIVISTAEVTTLAGTAGSSGSTDGTGTSARFAYPEGITTDGTNLFVSDTNNHTIRKIANTPTPLYTLTITKSGTGSGTVTSDVGGINCGATCSDSYTSGTTVTLTVAANTGSTFAGWSGDADCSDGVVAMDADKTCTATFTITPVNATPVANAGTDQIVEATSPSGASVTLNGSLSSDPDSDALSFTWTWSSGGASGISPAITLPLGVHNITLEVSDGQATATDDVTITVQDTTPPTITSSQNPLPNANGWNNTDVTVTFTVTDMVSTATCSPASVTVSTEGANQIVNTTCTDQAGNSATASHTVNIDKTVPTVTVTRTPEPNLNGWNNTDVTAHFTATDTLSGVHGDSFFDVFFTLEGAGQGHTHTFTDLAGNTGSAIISDINIDKTAPVIICPANLTAEATSSAGAIVSYPFATATDEASTPTIAYSQASGTVFPLGTTQVMATATDAAGNSASCSFNVAVQDTIPPAITSSQNPPPNANGWNNTDVTITFTATDAVSTAIQCEIVALQLSSASPISVTLSNEGASQTVNVICKDEAENSATASHTVNIDKTAPVVTVTRTPDANANGWNNTDVTAHFTATDSLSGISISGGGTFDLLLPITGEGVGQGATQTFTDLAGNTGSASVSNINIDKTPPLLTLPSFAASYTLGSGLTISFSATDSLSLIETMEAMFNGTPITDGASVTLTQIGVNTFSLNAADRAGNNINETRTFTVNYSFGGFLSPLVPDGTYNLGRVIPVKFALSDANGNPMSSAVARLSLQQISGGDPVGEPIEASSVSSADSGNIFRYNGDHYIYNLDTRPLSAGIWQMQVMLDDGSVHTIQIGLKSK